MYAIARIQKAKSTDELRRIHRHCARTQSVSHAAPGGRVVTLEDPGSPLDDAVLDRIRSLTGKGKDRLRKNAVPAVELLLSASPEYFRPDDPSRAGYWQSARLEAWQTRAVQWLRSQFKDRLVGVWLHLDESTPHIHAVVVPVTPDGRLAVRETFGPAQLRQLQTSYAGALEDLGIRRGVPRSQARHEPVRRHYTAVRMSDLATERVRVSTPPPMVRARARKEWAERETARIREQVRPLAARAAVQERESRRAEEMRRTATQAQAEARQMARISDDLLRRLRGISLERVLADMGQFRTQKDRWQWRGAGHRITLDRQQFRWYDHEQQRGGGGAIDLVQHLLGCSFREAVAWLQDRYGPEPAAATVREAADRIVEASGDPPPFRLPMADETAWPTARAYLVEQRGLPVELVERLHREGAVYATRHQDHINLVFPATGGTCGLAEVHGTGGRYKGLVAGSRRDDAWWSMRTGDGDVDRVVLVEAAIDAMSYAALHPTESALVVSTSGVRSWHPVVDLAATHGWQIVCAYDADEAGDEAARRMMERCPEVVRERPPEGMDWNDVLRSFPCQGRGYGLTGPAR